MTRRSAAISLSSGATFERGTPANAWPIGRDVKAAPRVREPRRGSRASHDARKRRPESRPSPVLGSPMAMLIKA